MDVQFCLCSIDVQDFRCSLMCCGFYCDGKAFINNDQNKKSLSSGLQGWVFTSKKAVHKSSLKILPFFCEIISFLDVLRELVDFLSQSCKRNITQSSVKVRVFIGMSFMGDTWSQVVICFWLKILGSHKIFLRKTIPSSDALMKISSAPSMSPSRPFNWWNQNRKYLYKERGLDWTSGND